MQIYKIIMVLFHAKMESWSGWPYGKIEFIRKKVFPEYHDVVDLMERARLEMKAFDRSNNPNTKFIIGIDKHTIKSINVFFKALQVRGLNSNHLIVNDELVIDAKAFLQMTQKDRNTLIKEGEKFQAINDFDEIKLSDDARIVCKKYRLQFAKQRTDGILRILTAFQVKSRKELNFGEIQFEKLEHHDLDAVIKVFRETGKEYNEKFSKVIRQMANRFEVDNVSDFVAVAQYTARRLNQKVTSLQQGNSNPRNKPDGMRDADYYLKIVADTFFINESGFQDDIYDGFQNKLKACAKQYVEHGLRFKTLMAAANHYDKHFYLLEKIRKETVSPDRYFQIARDMCSDPRENPTWTQDGSSVYWQIHRHDGAFAVRYDNPYKGTAVIATLHVPSVRRQLCEGSPLVDAR